MGATCFMSAILQCLVHCLPVQRYFLREIGHNHQACKMYRDKAASATKSADGDTRKNSKTESAPKQESICLACEVDKLVLQYYGSANGVDVSSLAIDSSLDGRRTNGQLLKGDPLITAEMLAAAWKCGGMSHLAGYEQRDAHEFLHGFLEGLGCVM